MVSDFAPSFPVLQDDDLAHRDRSMMLVCEEFEALLHLQMPRSSPRQSLNVLAPIEDSPQRHS